MSDSLWRTLHLHPETSWKERVTSEILEKYLRENSDLVIESREGWICGSHLEEKASGNIFVRADMDAVCGDDGRPYHGCGHDGHMAMAAGAAAAMRGRKVGANVFFLFQPAEETGEGALRCLGLLKEHKADYILGCHNIPGFPAGMALLRSGTFACASCGMILEFFGKRTHAAYPELGTSPVPAVVELLQRLTEISAKKSTSDIISVVEVNYGSENFGIAAGNARICLTARSEQDSSLKSILGDILAAAETSAGKFGLRLAVSYRDPFPDTRNNDKDTMFFSSLLQDADIPLTMLKEPMRWSEDFGQYQIETKGFFFGIGSGENTAGLHTQEYVFPEALVEKGVIIWGLMIDGAVKRINCI